MNKQDVLDYISQNASDFELMKALRLACDKNVKSINAKAVVTIAKEIDPDALEIACDLARMVVENYPHYAGKFSEYQWAEDIENIHRLDKYEWKIVRGVMEWSQEDDFWKQQIRSGGNLRKHFDTMLVRIKSQPRRMEFIS